MVLRTLQLAAIMITALALIPAGAHFFEFPNKIHLARDQYFTVQSIYRGWSLFGVALIVAVVLDAILTFLVRAQRAAALLSGAAFIFMVATLVVFFAFTYPANQATANWTSIPANWADLRRQWEYSHVAGALLTFASLFCVSLSSLLTER
jgi:hypothetical protein